MKRGTGLVAAVVLTVVTSHPLCYVDDKPTDYDEVMTFCPEPQRGACCTDLEELEVEARFNAVGNLTTTCAEYYKEFQCGQCHSYSAHLYEILGVELGVPNGLTMTYTWCQEFVNACDGEVEFPTYDGDSYCVKHAGHDGTGEDQFWSYPYVERINFDPGLTELLPDLSNTADFPSQTISIKQSPDASMYWLLGQAGEVKRVDLDSLDSISTVVDISGGEFYIAYEEGLLDFAFGPMFGVTGYPSYFYLSYTCQLDDGLLPRNRLSKFEYFENDPVATRDSEEILLTTVPKFNSVHSAGWCGFKPSDYGNAASSHDLFWTTGDGGPQTDSTGMSQDTSNLLGSMMRISVPSSGTSYTSPSGNYPGGLPEICAPGLRNPFRCGFDRETDDLYCGSVGQTLVEAVYLIECGNNYGWSRFEGSRCQVALEDLYGSCLDADRTGFTFPYFEYCHPGYSDNADNEENYRGGTDICGSRLITGNSVIGGFVYRGEFFADLIYGAYVFGEYQQGKIYYVKEMDGQMVTGTIVSDGSVAIISLSENSDGELMVITEDYNIYEFPCGDLCASTCLDQAEEQPSYEPLGCWTDRTTNRVLSTTAPECELGDNDELQTAMSPAICASYCASLGGMLYAGVEFANECHCGTSSDDFTKFGSADNCDTLCTGNPGEICGGLRAISIYELGTPAPSPIVPTAPPSITSSTPPTPTPIVDGTLPPTLTPAVGATLPPTPMPVVGATTPPTPAPQPVDSGSYLGCYTDVKSARIMTQKSTSSVMTLELCSQRCDGYVLYGTQFSNECWCGTATSDYEQHGVSTDCTMECAGDATQICGGRNAMSVYSYESTPPSPTPPTPTTAPVVPPTTAPVSIPTTQPVSAPTPAPISTPTTAPEQAPVLTPTTAPDPPTVVAVTPVPVGDSSYLGCFGDSKSGRIMSRAGSSDLMTGEVCNGLCSGSTYYGTQYGIECWCGGSATVYDLYGTAVCDFACGGDADEICGGRNAVSVYLVS